ncbi:MAG: DUF115 domain-containing protein [Spirochaetia bacterium]|nr:DUF115 domain-containing protein [Spirochaetota bacterium]MCX8097125.1 DUF115 domain-containing protein [Spirochaetota bacterium]MDW8112106.1 DUF115 domain-containing protein [Spirochaetia bacterium]
MEVSIEIAKDGNPILKVKVSNDEFYLSSKYFPFKDAEKVSKSITIDNNILLFLGISNPYLIYSISRLYPDKEVVVVEPSDKIFNLVMSDRRLSRLLDNSNIRKLLVRTEEEFKEILSNLSYFNYYIHPQYRIIFDFIPRWEKSIKDAIRNLEINRNTLRRFGKVWLKNFITSFPYALNSKPVSSVFGVFSGMDVVVVGAGPSLDDNIQLLKELYSRSVVISVDTVWSYLVSNHIIADFVITVDPQVRNFIYTILNKSYDKTIFVADTLYPSLLYNFIPYQNIITFDSPMKVWQTIAREFNVSKGEIMVGGSVICSAIDFANRLGADRIILVGSDFSFPNKKVYSKGNYYELSHFLSSDIFSPYDQWKILSRYPLLERVSKEGRNVFTDPRMITFKEWIEKYIQTNKIRLVNLSREGLLISDETTEDIFQGSISRREEIEKLKGDLISLDSNINAKEVVEYIHMVIRRVMDIFHKSGIYGVVDELGRNEFLKDLLEIGLQEILLREYSEDEFLKVLEDQVLYIERLYYKVY